MQLTHHFTVPVPVEVAWAALNDLERVAGCFPGAAMTSFDGERFEGSCKVKLGPISMSYKGTGLFVERDEQARRAVIEAKGKDSRGNGAASVVVTANLAPTADDGAAVEVLTDLNITGRAAQFGRPVLQEVSDKILAEFAARLEADLRNGDGAGVDDSVTALEPAAADRPQQSPSRSDDLDLGTTVLPILLRRYAWPALGSAVVLVALWKLLRRR